MKRLLLPVFLLAAVQAHAGALTTKPDDWKSKETDFTWKFTWDGLTSTSVFIEGHAGDPDYEWYARANLANRGNDGLFNDLGVLAWHVDGPHDEHPRDKGNGKDYKFKLDNINTLALAVRKDLDRQVMKHPLDPDGEHSDVYTLQYTRHALAGEFGCKQGDDCNVYFYLTGDHSPLTPAQLTPEPATGLLIGAALCALGLARRRQRPHPVS